MSQSSSSDTPSIININFSTGNTSVDSQYAGYFDSVFTDGNIDLEAEKEKELAYEKGRSRASLRLLKSFVGHRNELISKSLTIQVVDYTTILSKFMTTFANAKAEAVKLSQSDALLDSLFSSYPTEPFQIALYAGKKSQAIWGNSNYLFCQKMLGKHVEKIKTIVNTYYNTLQQFVSSPADMAKLVSDPSALKNYMSSLSKKMLNDFGDLEETAPEAKGAGYEFFDKFNKMFNLGNILRNIMSESHSAI